MKNNRPIIVKKVIKKVAGHHGGNWKIAYADFVTAMMAFFIMMWLISATPQENLQGIAKYFTPTASFKADKGLGFDGGADPNIQEGVYAPESSATSLIYGSPVAGPQIIEANQNSQLTDSEMKNFVEIMNNIEKRVTEDMAENIAVDITHEGLRIQVMDSDGRPMFKPGTDEMQPYMKKILIILADLIKSQPNYISISGHTAAVRDIAENNIDYWKLSVLRSNQTRIFLSKLITKDQVIRLLGKADKDPFDARDKFGVKNIRTTITLLNNASIGKLQQSVPEKVLKQ